MKRKDNQILCCPWNQEPHQIKNRQYFCWNCGDLLGTIKTAEIEVQQDIFFLCRDCVKKLPEINQKAK